MLELLYAGEEKRFIKYQKLSAFALKSSVVNVIGGPRLLSDEECAQRLRIWQMNKPEHLKNGRVHFLGVGLPGIGIRVLSRDRFVAKPHLKVTFHGCEVLDHLASDDAGLDKVVEPVVRERSHYLLGLDSADLNFTPRGYPVAWSSQREDAEMTLTPESFRPNAPWTSNEDDYVIVVRDPQTDSVTVTWELTEDGSDEVTTCDFTVPAADLVDAADLLNATFLQHE